MGIFSSIINFASQDRTNLSNRRLVEYTNNQQRELADLEYERNSPKMQMKRFREAGLNPNLIYGQMSDGLYSAPNLQTSQDVAPTTDFNIDGASLLGAFQDFRLKNVEIDNAKKVGQGLEQDNIRKGIENRYLEGEKQIQGLQAIETYKNLVETNKSFPLERTKIASEIYNILEQLNIAKENLQLGKDRLAFDKKSKEFDRWVMQIADNIMKSWTGHSITSQDLTDEVIDSIKNGWSTIADWFTSKPEPRTEGGSGGW